MRRRKFITLLGGAAAWPFAAMAQQAGRTYRLGCLLLAPRDAPIVVAFFDELRRHGFIEGQNLSGLSIAFNTWTFHGVNAYPLARARRSGAVTSRWLLQILLRTIPRQVVQDSLAAGISGPLQRHLGVRLAQKERTLISKRTTEAQIAEAREIGMADFLDLHADRVL